MNSSFITQNSKLIAPVFGAILCGISMIWLDIPLAEFFRSCAGAWWVRAFEIATEAGDSKWILVPSLVLTVVFWRWKREVALRAFVVFAAVAGSGLSANLIKILVCRYRPTAYIDHGLSGFDPFAFVIDYSRNSFPSGHATTALSAAVALGLIAPRLRYFFWLAGGIVAFSRVVITAHYASDVIAGALIGGYWAMWMFRVIVKRNNIPTINS